MSPSARATSTRSSTSSTSTASRIRSPFAPASSTSIRAGGSRRSTRSPGSRVFLATDDASFINGTHILVDGGILSRIYEV